MSSTPFQAPGRFYRGNLHTHSTNSDGHLSVASVVRTYEEAGYDFLTLTDHFLERYGFPISDTRPFRGDNFTTLLGAELHAGSVGLGGFWHILAVGLPLDFAPTSPAEVPSALCARARKAGAFVAAAHPYWYGVTPEEIVSLGEIDAIETFNATCQGENDRGDSWHVLDTLLARGRRYLACATDDAHFNPQRPDWLRGWVHVRATHREPEALLESLRAGQYYSSTGPEIRDLQLEAGNQITIECSPCQAIFAAGVGSPARRVHGIGMERATFPLAGLSTPYLRVTVVDSASRRAWSNPIWL